MRHDDERPDLNPWLRRAKNAFRMSTQYYDTNNKPAINDALRMFNNEHPVGSKYNKPSYRYRSRVFRPKTRAAIRKNEAAAAAAFFSGMDAFNITAVDENDKANAAAAEVMHNIISYRLNHTMPWFRTCIGALQDACKTGVVISYNHWAYRESKRRVPVRNEEGEVLHINGEPQFREEKEVIEDKPCIKLIPVDRFRFHPGCDWSDPVNTSPFLIEMIPTYIGEVREKMSTIDPKTGQPKWNPLSDKEILHCLVEDFNENEAVRNKNRQNPKGQKVANYNEYSMVWVHRNIVRKSGKDYVYFTLGTKYLLTKPKLLKEVYWHGERPYTMGFSVLETHKPLPTGIAELGQTLQEEANDIVNSRLDNVKLVLNKRWIVKNNGQTDISTLVRNVAGSVTLTDDVQNVIPVEYTDVTASSYAEQDRLNLDHDELIGNFSQGSVQSNRKLNETVGGMSMLHNSAGMITDYLLRTFGETWVEPTLRQMVKLEAAYETDHTVMMIAKKKAQLMVRYGIDPGMDELLNKDLFVKVDVGLGASNPQFRLERFLFGISKFNEISQAPSPYLDLYEVAKELWSFMGYKSGERFMVFDEQEEDPKYQQLQLTIQQLQQALAERERGTDEKFQLELLKQEAEKQRNDDKIAADLIKADLQEDNKIQLEAVKAHEKVKDDRRGDAGSTGSTTDKGSNKSRSKGSTVQG